MPSLDTLFNDWQAQGKAAEENRKRMREEPVRGVPKSAETLRRIRASHAKARIEAAKLAPEPGRPTMICDKCGCVRDTQYVKVVEAWPKTEYVCIVCAPRKYRPNLKGA